MVIGVERYRKEGMQAGRSAKAGNVQTLVCWLKLRAAAAVIEEMNDAEFAIAEFDRAFKAAIK